MRRRLDEPSWWYGPDHSATAGWLTPLAMIYGWAARSRFVRTKPYRSRLPVICVGNLTAGGTGKTPLTLYLCDRLRAAGRQPVVLTRGYGGRLAGPHWVAGSDSADAVGDEPLLLAGGAPTLIARDRAAGARAIESDAEAADVIVMDDGLQNPQLAKDLTLAVVDGRRGLGNGRVMPAGPLRAPLDFQLALVDAIVVNEPSPGMGDAIAGWLGARFAKPVLRCTTVVAGDDSWLQGRRVVAWAGIGAPHRFFTLLRSRGPAVIETVAFGDHQRLEESDARRLLALAVQHEAVLVSTAKDMARLTGTTGALAELAGATHVLPIALRFAEPDAVELMALIDAAIRKRAPAS